MARTSTKDLEFDTILNFRIWDQFNLDGGFIEEQGTDDSWMDELTLNSEGQIVDPDYGIALGYPEDIMDKALDLVQKVILEDYDYDNMTGLYNIVADVELVFSVSGAELDETYLGSDEDGNPDIEQSIWDEYADVYYYERKSKVSKFDINGPWDDDGESYYDEDRFAGYVEDDEYTPSATRGDYSPSNPWDAPGMSMSDFI